PGSIVFCFLRSAHSFSNHPAAPRIAFTRSSSLRGFPGRSLGRALVASTRRSGLRHLSAGSPASQAESSSLSYGLVVHFQLLSTPFRKDAVTFRYRPERRPEEDLHLSDQTQLQTYCHGLARA